MAVGLKHQMMKVFFLQVCLFTGCVFADNAFSWKNCDSNTPVQIETISLSPTPVPLKKGADITFGSSVEVKGDTGVNYKAKVVIKKKVGAFLLSAWIPLSCVKNVGSCTYDNLNCHDIWKDLNEPAQCPVTQGSIQFPNTTITLPEINLPSFLTSGTYWVRAKLENTENKELLACVEINVEIN